MNKVILIRHVTPLVSNTPCSYQVAKQRLVEYNNTEKLNFAEINLLGVNQDNLDTDTIYSSSLIRAIKTADYLFPHKKIITTEKLVEFNLDIFPIPILNLSFKNWLFVSRVLWLIGINKSQKNLRQEKQRVANFIHENVNKDCTIVAHGFVLNEIQSHLIKNGFNITIAKKQGCFSITILERKT
ncbi:histidine phosphatase family protein [Pasteurella multocida]|uniref:histidine phosphatase family protein n=1 Tax=Pasteurella multocida TaxID=747 RepID=UPI0020236D05|nr:histidine phosphatase family protein [Pasteurella multocida]MEB3451397.1 histidine phosphatase family protein [Pasteurella multocida]MEB3453633.1 histidine phosphatase family protein [Pasteurella multocida]MEB3455782.1 histidine phosphatase family protein [Pasteurella multocida]MEB3459042.1 histidine phosphatase family protein [Pasteurella multocida]MEB3461312.1 histidine phosphatase family protein [Pasteurella multocida]